MSFLVIFTLVVSLLAMPVFAEDRVVDKYVYSLDTAECHAAELMAGKTIDVGDVYIDAIGINKYLVTYKITAKNWFFSEIHFEAINKGDEAFIYSKGGLIPGKFTVNKSFELEKKVTKFSFIYTSGAPVIGFAAHAVVKQPAVYQKIPHFMTVVSDTATKYLNTMDGLWHPSALAWVHPSWPTIDGAKWIWESYMVDTPRTGDTVKFKRDFSVIGVPTKAKLWITADNQYAAMINGMPDPAMAGADWSVVNEFNVLPYVKGGANALTITGINWPWGTDDPKTNPGAVIFKLYIESLETKCIKPEVTETAWGMGKDADGSNWSQIICKVPHFYDLIQTLTVAANSTTGTNSSVLLSGKDYRFVVSGTWNNRSVETVDAEYSKYGSGGAWLDAPLGTAEPPLLDLVINGAATDWGAFNPYHVYMKNYTGAGAAVNFHVYDNWYDDNIGSLTVKVYRVY